MSKETLSLRATWTAVACLILLFVGQCLWSARQESPTIDEFRHIPTGLYLWRSGDFSFDPATPPLWKMVCALPAQLMGANLNLSDPALNAQLGGWEPWFFATSFMEANDKDYDRILFYSRVINVLAAAAVVLLVFVWSLKLYGKGPALVATTLAAFSPSLLAHARYVTTDVIATLLMACTVFFLIEFLRNKKRESLFTAAVIWSLSVVSKFSGLLLAPLVLLAAMITAPNNRLRLGNVALVMAVFVITVDSVYLFKDLGPSIASSQCRSGLFRSLQSSPLSQVPLPLPAAFLKGFDIQKADSEMANFPSFFMGCWSSDGFWYYFLAAFALKETIPFLCLLILALFWRPGRQAAGNVLSEAGCLRGKRDLFVEGAFFWFVPVVLLVVLSLFCKLDVGLRYLLPCYPFFWIACAGLAASALQSRWKVITVSVLVLWSVGETCFIAPHYLAYFNEFCGGPQEGHNYLIDSNLDWGQDLINLKKYLDDNHIGRIQLAYFGHAIPEHYGIDYELLLDSPHPGIAAVSATLLEGHPYMATYARPPLPVTPGAFCRLRRLKPVAAIGYSILVYRIPER